MPIDCEYCGGPLSGPGLGGRPRPGRPAATYCCFGCLSLGEHRPQEVAPAGRLDGLGLRLGVGILVVGQSMIFGLALNLHDDIPDGARWVAQTLILCATTVVVLLLGGPLLRTACVELCRGRLTIEALFLLTIFGAMAASLQAYFTGRGKIYFEVVSVLLVVYTLGKVIGARSRAVALAGSRAWAGQLETCRLVDEAGRTRTVPVVAVRPGDVVEVYPGETIAVDGVIRDGVGFVSAAAVSGEPFAVVRRPGGPVLAGSTSHDATFRVIATAPGTERQIDHLVAAVDAARDRPLSRQARADRLGQWFLPLVVVTALGTFGYWAFLTPAGWEAGLFNAMSVLLVACPCAIGLATPIVIWSVLGRLAERGLIVRTGHAVERLADIDCVLLDKTGTLTDDRFALLDIATAATGDERATVLGWLSLVESRSSHPIARPFAQLPRPFAAGEEPRVRSLRAVPGCGIEAEIAEADGARHTLRVGRPEWLSANAPHDLAAQLRATGYRIDVTLDGDLAAVAVVAERVRESAPEMLAEFARLGLPVELLTGDTAERAAAIGLPTRASLLPDDKREHVEQLKAAGRKPLMVGDGINDASALATAHVGIALASGADLAVGAAAATLYHDDLRVLPWAVLLSRAAVRAVRRNLYRAVCYNLIGMALAAAGLLHPIAAVLLMMVSSLSLVFSATRIGETAEHCDRRANSEHTSSARTAFLHALALALQGVAFLFLLEPARELTAVLVVAGFALGGVALAYLWNRWAAIPHTLDMCFGMLTLGNLGMLLGWWADNGFAPLRDAACCGCVGVTGSLPASPWMWGGMLLFANVAMLRLGRRSLPWGDHRAAMLTGGNLGMVAGMLTGGWCATQLPSDSVSLTVATSFVTMTVGMLTGMLLGTWIIEGTLHVLRTASVLPRWVRDPRLTD